MKSSTHFSFTLALSSTLAYYVNMPIYIFIGVFFGLLPDIDVFGSVISRKSFPFSLIPNLFAHRGFFHSALFGIIVGYFAFMFDYWFGVFSLVGVFSHLFLDMLTKSGVVFFWPMPLRVRIMKRGKLIEPLIGLASWAVSFVFLLILFLRQA